MCVAGGWVGGSIKDADIFNEVDLMFKLNVQTSLLTGHLATKFLNNQGLLVFTGAAVPFREPTPNMLAYGLSKTATHAIALNMSQGNDIPKDSVVTSILPEVIDTPENRKAMPDADFSTWTTSRSIAGLLKMWADGVNRPINGSYAILKNKNGMTLPEFV